ncbi:MAG TPA: class I SAM-dependent methyltransferase [Candidatus Bathyarchaeia archaeon]|jgi:ubiquinone/menaquinone biosynthesis C-methylase UbiE|nr:class I SAM-dependent methyltransferase [Candidatus Bathyarchaeia archaeon]
MYDRFAEIYDAIYSFKNYEKESARLHELIQQYKRSPGTSLLDVACGTGGHIAFLKSNYSVEGLDISRPMLDVARKKHPEVVFHHGDMATFKLRKQFDVVTCLFSAIGHLKTKQKLDLSIRNMAQHAKTDGVVIVEPWLTPEQYNVGRLNADFVDQPKLKIARVGISNVRRGLSVLDLHHLVGRPEGVKYFVERLVLGLYTHKDYLDAFRKAKLETIFDPEGLMGRGLYIGRAS